jgi:excisionase family DNA binding protein
MTRSTPTTRAPRDPKLDVEEAADELGVSVRFVRRLIAENRIEYVKHGTGRRSPVRIRLSVIERYLEEHTVRPTR